MARRAAVDQVFLQLLVFLRFVVQRRELGELEVSEVSVELADGFAVARFAGRVHDRVGDFHVCESVEHGDFAP